SRFSARVWRHCLRELQLTHTQNANLQMRIRSRRQALLPGHVAVMQADYALLGIGAGNRATRAAHRRRGTLSPSFGRAESKTGVLLRRLARPRLPARRLRRTLRSCGLILLAGGARGATLMSGGMRQHRFDVEILDRRTTRWPSAWRA